MRIKEENEWKKVFIIYVRFFKLIFMFFGITNSSATFQTIINGILRDMINKKKVAVFVDNILVGTETEKEHDKIVEEVLKRLKKNNLYVKLEKHTWKVRKIEFLGVIIKPNSIEIEREKINRVLS